MTASEIRKISREECADILLGIEHPLILCHIRPDGDTVGTAVALAKIYEALGKKAEISCAHPIPERLAFLLDEVEVTDKVDGRCCVAVDVASPSQLGAIYERDIEIACVIDHHESSTPYAPHLTVGEASSAGEVLYDIFTVLEKRGLVKLSEDIARPLYASISSDTGCFAYSNTRENTHLVAARLVACGIDTADINHRLFHCKSREQILAEAFVGSKISLAEGGRVAYCVITLAALEELGLSLEHFETAVDVIRSVRGVEVAISAKEVAGGEYKFSLRSTGAPVSRVAEHFGGGGHLRASGFSVKTEDIDATIKEVLSLLSRLL